MQISDIKQINKVSNDLVEVIYGDSVTGDTMISTKEGYMSIEEMYNDGYNSKEKNGKEYVKSFIKVKSPYGEYNNIKYIMRHKTHKKLYGITTKNNNYVKVTEDHSLMICKSNLYKKDFDLFVQLKELSPKETEIGDYVLTLQGTSIITNIEDLGIYEDYVYDICVDTNDKTQHVFYANDILVHNTDSLYLSYEGVINSIEGSENWTIDEKANFIVRLNQEFLDQHNREVMDEHYKSRHANSVQNFELETLALSGVWLNVKKRYAQVLLWKDGKTYSTEDSLPIKAKGLELIKASYPKQSREALNRLVRYLLEDDGESDFLLHRLNAKMQEEKRLYYEADIDDMCASMKINGYNNYMICDNNPTELVVKSKCPSNVKAAGNYNRIRQVYNLPGDPIHGGKVKYYIYSSDGSMSAKSLDYFAYQAKNYPEWASKYAPIAKGPMFQKFTLDPFNRIIEAIGLGKLYLDGSIQMSMPLF